MLQEDCFIVVEAVVDMLLQLRCGRVNGCECCMYLIVFVYVVLQERDMVVTGGLTWWKDFICVACFNVPDQRDEVRV